MALDQRQQAHQLLDLAAVRQREHDVVLADDAEVAVRRLGGVQEGRRRAGAGQRRGDLAADEARLADARDDDLAAAVGEDLHGALEALVEPLRSPPASAGDLDGEHAPAALQRLAAAAAR